VPIKKGKIGLKAAYPQRG